MGRIWTQEQKDAIEASIKKRVEYGTLTYVSAEEAWEEYKKEYFKDAWKDIVGNLIHYNGGDAEECLECCINHFDCNGEYIETYRITPTTEEMSEFLEDCQNWDIASLG